MEEMTPEYHKLTKVVHVLKKLMLRKFFGKITISFENGFAVNINVSESFKVE